MGPWAGNACTSATIAYTCNMTAPDRERGLRLQKFHSVRGSGCKLGRGLLLQICRDRAKKRMTRNRRWGLCRSIISRKCPGSDHGCMSTGREAGKSNKKISTTNVRSKPSDSARDPSWKHIFALYRHHVFFILS